MEQVLQQILDQLKAFDARLDHLERGQAALERGQAEIKEAIKGSQDVVVELVDVVGQKVDGIDRTIRDMQGATAQNSYELQVLKSKAQ